MKTKNPTLSKQSRLSRDHVLCDQIGARLKNDYGRLLCEPLPERFGVLLDRLKASSGPASANTKK